MTSKKAEFNAEKQTVGISYLCRFLFYNSSMNKFLRKIIHVLFVVFFCVTTLCILNRSGSLILTWKELPINSVTHDAGYGYYAFLSDENVSALDLPVFLVEDGKPLVNEPLSVNEDRVADIKNNGGGSYTVLENNDLYFSASDNDPEQHEYAFLVPEIIRNRWLLMIAFFLLALTVTMVFLERADLKELLRKTLFPAFMMLGLLLIPWYAVSTPINMGGKMILPVFQRTAGTYLLLAATAVVILAQKKSNKMMNAFIFIIVAVNLFYYFVPEWNYFGLRTDSFSYLEHHTASSIRTIGYPAFIEVVNDDADLETMRGEFGAELYANYPEQLVNGTAVESHGLLKTVHLQKLFLASALVILCAVMMSVAGWFPCLLFAEWVLCGGFLGVDNSYIMSECLSQAVLLIASACFIAHVKYKSLVAYLLGSVFSAFAVLVRPSNIFFLPLVLSGAIILLIKKENRRRCLAAFGGLLLYFIIAAIPAVEIYASYGRFLWMPVSEYAEVGRALSLMETEDKELFTDEETSVYVDEVLKAKEGFAAEHDVIEQNDYVWNIAVKTAEKMGYDRIECSWLFSKVSKPILKKHFSEFATAVKDSFMVGLSKTRLTFGSFFKYPVLILTALALFFAFAKSKTSVLGVVFILLHNLNVLLCAVNQPEKRYIYYSEILFILGFILILKDLQDKRNENRD